MSNPIYIDGVVYEYSYIQFSKYIHMLSMYVLTQTYVRMYINFVVIQ